MSKTHIIVEQFQRFAFGHKTGSQCLTLPQYDDQGNLSKGLWWSFYPDCSQCDLIAFPIGRFCSFFYHLKVFEPWDLLWTSISCSKMTGRFKPCSLGACSISSRSGEPFCYLVKTNWGLLVCWMMIYSHPHQGKQPPIYRSRAVYQTCSLLCKHDRSTPVSIRPIQPSPV